MDLLTKLHRLDTAKISDALDSYGIEGALLGIKPLSPGTKMVGPAFTLSYLPYEAKPTEFKNAADYIDDVPANAVIIIDNQGRQDCTAWGDILTRVALQKNIAGTVVFGAARDVQSVRESNYPLFASAIYMRSGKNRIYKSAQQCELSIQGIPIKPGDIIMGDDNGVVVIPQQHLKDIIHRAENIEATEKAIIASIQTGMRLEEARKLHRYDQPWLDENKPPS